MKFTKFFIALLVLLVLLLALAFTASAQPYYTNQYVTNNLFGPALYNSGVSSPLTPVNTRNNQWALGLNYGSITNLPGGSNVITFPTNYVYSTPPTVIVQPLGIASPTSGVTNLIYVTTSNAFYFNGLTSPATNQYIIIGK